MSSWSIRSSSFDPSVAAVRAVVFALALVFAAADGASAAPQSLRSETDVHDVVDSFMSEVVGNQVGAAYAGLAGYWPGASRRLSALVAEATARRRHLRKTIGLSIGTDRIGIEYAGDRVLRVTRLERFDDGAVVWRFVFYRADSAWQITNVDFSEDLRVLFGALPADAAPIPAVPSADGSAEPAARTTRPARDSESQSGSDSGYDIDIDGRK